MLNTPSAVADALTEMTLGESDMTASALEAASQLTLDSLGVSVAAHGQPGIVESLELMQRWAGAMEATIWLTDRRVPLPNAAFTNSAMVHALDFDDKHYGAGMHVMATTLPVACATAELNGNTGREMLEAIVVGVEVSTRLGEALMEARMNRGFLPSSLVGGFGATAAAARLLDLSDEQTRNAFGLWYCQASGTRQALVDRSLGKRLQPAFAARSALWAIDLARLGVTGPAGAVDGEAGLFRLFAGTEAPSPNLLIDPGRSWAIESYWIKRYPSCGGCHRPTEAAILLAEEHDVDPHSIHKIVVEVGESSGWHLGSPFEIRSDPQVDAQFSIPYSVALGLSRRHAHLEDYETDEILANTEIVELSRLVDVDIRPNTSHLRSDQVEISLQVTMEDGRVLEKKLQDLQGSPSNPLTFEQVVEKFRRCCDYARLAESEADGIIRAVSELEQDGTVDSVLKALTAAGATLSSDPLRPH